MIGRSDFIGIDLSGACWTVTHVTKGPFGVEPRSHFKLEGPSQDMAAQLGKYMEEQRAQAASIALALPTENCLTKAFRLPAADNKAAMRMLGFELDRHLPSDASQWRWSLSPLKTEVTHSTVMLSAVKAKELDEVSGLFTAAGLPLAFITSGQAALLEAVRQSGFITAGESTAIISVSENTFLIELVRDGLLLYTSRAPVGAASREIGFAVSYLRETPSSFIIIDEDASMKTMELISGSAREFSGTIKVFGPVPALSRSHGAAMMAMEGTLSGANLIQREDAVSMRGKALAYAGGAMLVMLVVGAGVAVNDILILRGMEKEIALLGDDRIKAQMLMREARNIRTDLKALEDIKGASSSEFLQMLGRLTELTPEDTYLTGLEYGKESIIVNGVSQRASGLFMQLSRSGFADNINYDGPVTRGQDGKERFRIKFRQTGGNGHENTRTGP